MPTFNMLHSARNWKNEHANRRQASMWKFWSCWVCIIWYIIYEIQADTCHCVFHFKCVSNHLFKSDLKDLETTLCKSTVQPVSYQVARSAAAAMTNSAPAVPAATNPVQERESSRLLCGSTPFSSMLVPRFAWQIAHRQNGSPCAADLKGCYKALAVGGSQTMDWMLWVSPCFTPKTVRYQGVLPNSGFCIRHTSIWKDRGAGVCDFVQWFLMIFVFLGEGNAIFKFILNKLGVANLSNILFQELCPLYLFYYNATCLTLPARHCGEPQCYGSWCHGSCCQSGGTGRTGHEHCGHRLSGFPVSPVFSKVLVVGSW